MYLHRNHCSPACLFARRHFIGQFMNGRRILFRTSADTLIKVKKFRKIEVIWGAPVKRNLRSRQEAFAALLTYRPQGVLIPLHECECAYEVPIVAGTTVIEGLLFSGHNDGLSFAQEFVCQAKAILDGLHQLGIRHGDPGLQNFLITQEGPLLIDLDDINLGSQNWARRELLKFLRYIAIPCLGRRRALLLALRHCIKEGYLAAVTIGTLCQVLRRGRSRAHVLCQILFFYLCTRMRYLSKS